MTALGIRYLTGRAVAADSGSGNAEWPPHPARVFMALAAAHFDGGGLGAERAALEWLERLPAPKLFASSASPRTVYETYVPVNDAHGGIGKRSRQPRSFPSIRPDCDSVYLLWDQDPTSEVEAPLAQLCSRVTRVGHSSSLVQVWLTSAKNVGEPNWLPDSDGGHAFRVSGEGMLRALEASFNGEAIQAYQTLKEQLASATGRQKAELKREIESRFGKSEPKSERPVVSSWQNYRNVVNEPPAAAETPIESPFDSQIIVLAKVGDGPALGLESTLQLTAALRNAALKAAPEPHPEWFSGHQPEGSPTRHPHLAFFPLPFVASQHADGHVMGLAIAVPRSLPEGAGTLGGALRRYLGPLLFDPDGESRAIEIWRERAWKWTLARNADRMYSQTLDQKTWVGPSRNWASVTPVVLHHYPKKGSVDDVERIVREAFVSALLPEPESIRIQSVSAHRGAGHARDLPLFTEGGANLTRYQTHVKVRFSSEVLGPVLVGRGRFRGYGLFRQTNEEQA